MNCDERLIQVCGTSGSGDGLDSQECACLAVHHAFIAIHLFGKAEVAYDDFLERFAELWPDHADLARVCAATHAETDVKLNVAIRLGMLVRPTSIFSGLAARLVLRVFKKQLLAEEFSGDDADCYTPLLMFIFSHLGLHPNDKEFRADLLRALSVESAGSIGFNLLISITFRLALTLPQNAPGQIKPLQVSDAELEMFMNSAFIWLKDRDCRDLSATMPREIVGQNASGIARRILKGIEQAVHNPKISDEKGLLEELLPILVALAKHVSGCVDDIQALRFHFSAIAHDKNPEVARDGANQVLDIAGDSDERKRVAWAAFADISFRCGSLGAALLGLACAASTRAVVPIDKLLEEVQLLARMARALRNEVVALEALALSRDLCQKMNVPEVVMHRMEVNELMLRSEVIERGNHSLLAALHINIQRAVEDAIRLGEKLDVVGALYAQISGRIERMGGSISTEARALKERVFGLIDSKLARRLRVLSDVKPSVSDLIWLHNMTPITERSVNAPVDAREVTMVARRILRCPDERLTPRDAFLAMELLAERGVKLQGPIEALTLNWPIEFARRLADRGLGVLMVALDDANELIACIADSTGTYVVRLPTQGQTASQRVYEWAKTYPYRLGTIDPKAKVFNERSQRWEEVGDGDFHRVMHEFQIPLPVNHKVIVIASPKVATLTFNLIKVGTGQFAGYDTAIGIAPSLTWLASAVKQQTCGNGRRIAWISDGGESGDLTTMTVVRAMIEETLSKHNIFLDTSKSLVSGANGAQLVIVVAHGQLTSEKRFIHRISDEGALEETPSAFANALATAELVVLFVCSGGRIDSHPIEHTTVGLPKMLLDGGSRAVVASPWPLDSGVPGIWLPAFMESWDNGATVLDACHVANTRVATRREGEPQMSLAMTVYGDPLLKKAD